MSDISATQHLYIKKQKRLKQLILFLRLFLFLAFLFIWEITARLGIIDSFIFSSPTRVCTTFWEMVKDNSLLLHISVTLIETLVSFLLVVFLGTSVAVALWCSPVLSKILEPYLVVLNSLPKSALAPLLIVWLGANMQTIIVAGISVAIFGSIINLYSGFQAVDADVIKLVSTLGGNKKDALLKVVLPSSVPLILSVMKVNIGLCLVGVIIGEFIGAKQGLGYLIIYGSQVFKLDWVIMSIVILCLVATALYGLLNLAEHLYLKRR